MRPGKLGRLDVEAGVRAGICVLVPLLVLLFAGLSQLSAYVAFAAFTSLYGRYEAYRSRLVTVVVAGISFLVIIAVAMVVAMLGGGVITIAVGLFIVSALGVVLSSHMGWIPFGSVFYVFSFSVISSIPVTAEEYLPRYSISVATVVFCWIVAMAGWLIRRAPGRHQAVLSRLRKVERRPGAWRDGIVWLHAGENALGVVVALLIAAGMGLSHSYWAAVAVAACVPRPYAPRKVTRIIHRVIGTALGVVVTGLILLTGPPVWVVIVIAAFCQFMVELFVGKVYWFALLFITPLALLVGQLSAPAPVGVILTDRVLDTTIGGMVALVLVLAGTGAAVTWKQYRAEAAQAHT
ncbi:FUSC family protein [Brevibacterium daeguense]|uniref:FUSC family protein n=2 Tax=Brevibacterium daeguense TaxID=909936 RepID=A0ABP8EN20_9MICO